MNSLNHPETIVVVTLGSNGFHLISMTRKGDSLVPGDHLYRNVSIQSFVNEQGYINEKGIESVRDALSEFGKYLTLHPPTISGAIATGTFRYSKNGLTVVTGTEEILGMPIKVLSGEEEGLLCYLGIASTEGLAAHNRLVIDIGGASTEIMIARGNSLIEFYSLELGCVSLTEKMFTGSTLSRQLVNEADQYVDQKLTTMIDSLVDTGWVEAFGCGGTMSSMYSILRSRRMTGISVSDKSLDRFWDAVWAEGSVEAVSRGAVTGERTRLLPAGVVILQRIMHNLGIEKIKPVFSSVGQGLIVKLAGQIGKPAT